MASRWQAPITKRTASGGDLFVLVIEPGRSTASSEYLHCRRRVDCGLL